MQAAGWGRGVDAFAQAHEHDPQGLQFVNQGDQVPEVPADSIQSPAQEQVKASASGIGRQLVESTTRRPLDARSVMRPVGEFVS